MENKEKYNRLQELMNKVPGDVLFIQNPATISYFTNFTTEPHERVVALVLLSDNQPTLFVPALEHEAAIRAEPSFNIVSYYDHQDPWELLATFIKTTHPNPMNWIIEKEFLPYSSYEQLKQHFPHLIISGNLTDTINRMRLIKTSHEIELMKKSGAFADLAIKIGLESLTEGISEIEVVSIIEFELKKKGIAEMSFPTMVLFGDHAADPHGIPGNRTLKKGEFVLFDLGVMYEGFASDITRTIFYGDEPTEQQIELYTTVQDAHDQAISFIKPGKTAHEIDQTARQIITEVGYGEYFIHRLGHGIGHSVHEFPSISQQNHLVLEEGMCFSVEPGIYLPNELGIRIEDCGVVTKNGFELFTRSPYQHFIKS